MLVALLFFFFVDEETEVQRVTQPVYLRHKSRNAWFHIVSNDLIKHLSQTIILCRELSWHVLCRQKFSAYQQLEASLLTCSSSILCSSHHSRPEALLSSLPSEQNGCEAFGPQLRQILSKQRLSAFPSSVSDLRILPELLFIFPFYGHTWSIWKSLS